MIKMFIFTTLNLSFLVGSFDDGRTFVKQGKYNKNTIFAFFDAGFQFYNGMILTLYITG